MMNCDLCKKIWGSIDEYQGQLRYLSDEKIGIVMKDKKPWLYIPVDPPHYSDAHIQINFCPKCGRQVNLDYKVGCCLHPYKIYCKNSSLWTPKGYIRGLRADLSILDDYCGAPQKSRRAWNSNHHRR